MLKKLLMSTAIIVALGQNLSAADDYYLYTATATEEWTPDGHPAIDVTGYIDTNGSIEGIANAEYVFFIDGWYGNTGYIYRVDVDGNPNQHPNNPDATGPVANRIFTFVSSHVLSNARAQSAEFYVDNTGIYYGSGKNIKRWNFDWSGETDIITNGNINSETLARNTTTGEWWTGIGCCGSDYNSRKIYKYDNNTSSWQYQFTYPSLGGGHHDGMEIVNGDTNTTLYISDMTSDKIIAYDLNQTTGLVIPDSNRTYSYTASPYVEGMGYGPNKHFWIGSGTGLYEIGAGGLKPSCSQTFHFNRRWDMQTSKCDDITVPGFDDTLMVTVTDDEELRWVTADAGTIAWLAGLGITAESNVTLKSGQGFWTYGKFDGIDKLVSNGKVQDNYVSLENGIHTFIGYFSHSIDLNNKFGTKPVEKVYYFNGGVWHTWIPTDGSETVVAGQGLYVLPNGDFSILVK